MKERIHSFIKQLSQTGQSYSALVILITVLSFPFLLCLTNFVSCSVSGLLFSLMELQRYACGHTHTHACICIPLVIDRLIHQSLLLRQEIYPSHKILSCIKKSEKPSCSSEESFCSQTIKLSLLQIFSCSSFTYYFVFQRTLSLNISFSGIICYAITLRKEWIWKKECNWFNALDKISVTQLI